MLPNGYCAQVKETYPEMDYYEFDSICRRLNFQLVMSKSEKTQREDMAIMHTKLYVQQEHSYILYVRVLNESVVLATLYAQVYFDGELTDKQKVALKGSGYQIVDKDKIYFGFSVTKDLYSKVEKLMFEFTPVKKWSNLGKVCLGFVDNTFENKCGRGTGFTLEELSKSILIERIIYEKIYG